LDVVYLIKGGHNEELRWSLRSLANVPHDRVWLFGGKPPKWVQNTKCVRTPQDGTKYVNTTAAIKAACEHPDVSDPFILMNDDFYILRRTQSIPALHRGPVDEVIADYKARFSKGNTYIVGMERTMLRLQEMGYERPLSYELHTPMVVEKAAMLEALEAGSDLEVIHKRTMYGNIAGLGGRRIDDVKVRNKTDTIPRGTYLSMVEGSFEEVRPVLRYFLGDDLCEYESYVSQTVKTTPLSDPVCIGHSVLFGSTRYPAGSAVPLRIARQMYRAGHLKDERLAWES